MTTLSRRRFCALAGALSAATFAAGGLPRRVLAHSNAGRVVPAAPAPPVRLTLHDGRSTSLHNMLEGHVTAVQLVFTRCRATCPIQAAVFASAQRELSSQHGKARLLSISIDPGGDDPATLKAWLKRYEAEACWSAARPEPRDLEGLLDFLKARASGPDRHTAQVYYFDRRAALTMRSVDFPPAAEIARALDELATQDA